jgi:hypothetical protein
MESSHKMKNMHEHGVNKHDGAAAGHEHDAQHHVDHTGYELMFRNRFWISLVKNNPLDVVKVIGLSQSSHRKMVQNLAWATGYNVATLPLAAGVLAPFGVLLSPAFGALLMSLSTVIVSINAQFMGREQLGKSN